MDWIRGILLVGLFSPLLAFGQADEPVTWDMITLKMPVALAELLQRRIDEGGKAAEDAMTRLPDLVQSKKIEELDRWHVEGVSGTMREHFISTGRDLKLGAGEIQPRGIKIELEPTGSSDGMIDTRFAVESHETAKSDHSSYMFRQICTSMVTNAGQWASMGNWRDGDEIVMLVGRFNAAVKKSDNTDSTPIRSGLMKYSVCLLEKDANAPDTKKPITGDTARTLLQKAKILESGVLVHRAEDTWVASSQMLPMDGKGEGEAGSFSFEGCIRYSADHRTSEFGVNFSLDLPGKAGKHRRASLQDWMALTMGETVLLPMSEDSQPGNGTLMLALAPTVKVLTQARDSEHLETILVHPAAQRLLAEAAGIPVSKPQTNHPGFANLPPLKDSLAQLGLVIPSGVEVRMDGKKPSIMMFGKNAPHAKLKEILAKHLPTATPPNPQ